MTKAEIERIFFYYLCGKEMADKIDHIEKMRYEDFDEIVYILMELQFTDFLTEFLVEFHEHWEGQEIPLKIKNIAIEAVKCECFLRNFCNKAPTEELREILMEIFELDNRRRFIYYPDGTII